VYPQVIVAIVVFVVVIPPVVLRKVGVLRQSRPSSMLDASSTSWWLP
jgi:hypothetical protein